MRAKTLRLLQKTMPADFKTNSKLNKYLRFVLDEHREGDDLLPIFPLSIKKLALFVVYAEQNKVKGGYSSISNYVAEVVKLGTERYDQPDPRTVSDQAKREWKSFVSEFMEENVPVTDVKWRLQAAMLFAMLMDCDLDTWQGRRDTAQYTALWFGTWRVGHVATANRKKNTHLLEWRHLLFWPNRRVQEVQRVFVLLDSTKTRKKGGGKKFWTTLERVDDENGGLLCCPARAMALWYETAYDGDSSAPVFTAGPRSALHKQAAQTRTEFHKVLRERLQLSLHRLDIDPRSFDVKKVAGVSFRKGGLSELGRTGIGINRLAEHADHASLESTRAYTSDTVEERSTNTSRMANRMSEHYRDARGLSSEESAEIQAARLDAAQSWDSVGREMIWDRGTSGAGRRRFT